jgi:hypothetical protein
VAVADDHGRQKDPSLLKVIVKVVLQTADLSGIWAYREVTRPWGEQITIV